VVDVNPRKQGTFLPGSGHPVVAPETLLETRPDLVVAMNGMYREEIQRRLSGLGLDIELICLP